MRNLYQPSRYNVRETEQKFYFFSNFHTNNNPINLKLLLERKNFLLKTRIKFVDVLNKK